MQPPALVTFLQSFVGTYEGGGVLTLFRIRSFDIDDDKRVPNGFVSMDIRDFSRTGSLGVIHMHELEQYWFLEEINLLALNTFIGLGYAKVVKRAQVNPDKTAI